MFEEEALIRFRHFKRSLQEDHLNRLSPPEIGMPPGKIFTVVRGYEIFKGRKYCETAMSEGLLKTLS